ncbi:MAG: TlpA disulfide reductase family protein [Thermaerobacter sp.]|nr:TlpA disulfide reductase family protein [Thermaerobacter sp.]
MIYPAVIQLGPLIFSRFALFLLLGALAALLLADREGRRAGLARGAAPDVLASALLGGILIGKLLPLLLSPATLLAGPAAVLAASWSPLGGLLGALAAGAWTLRRHRPTLPLLDALTRPLALAGSVSFLGWDRYGPPTTLPWGIPVGHLHLTPVPYLAATASLVVLAAVGLVRGRPGSRLLALAAGGLAVLALIDYIGPPFLPPAWPAAPAAVGIWLAWTKGGLNMRRRLWLIIPLALVLLAAAGLLVYQGLSPAPTGSAAAGRPSVGPLPGMRAPGFTLEDLSGHPVSLASLRGHPVYINFWATWCPPCRAEVPALKQIYARYGHRVDFLAIAEGGETASQVQSFVRQHGIKYRVLLDLHSRVGTNYLVDALPTHVFITPQGTVENRVVGGLPSFALIQPYIRQLLRGEKAK